MLLDVKTRLVLAGAVLGASLLTLTVANAQIDPATGAPTTTTTPGIPPGTIPSTQPSPYDTGTDAGLGGSGLMPTYPSPFDRDAGWGGTGFTPPSSFGGQDGGLF